MCLGPTFQNQTVKRHKYVYGLVSLYLFYLIDTLTPLNPLEITNFLAPKAVFLGIASMDSLKNFLCSLALDITNAYEALIY